MIARIFRMFGRGRITDKSVPQANLSDDAEKLATLQLVADTMRRANYLKQEAELYGHRGR